jgi:hypothetical protein
MVFALTSSAVIGCGVDDDIAPQGLSSKGENFDDNDRCNFRKHQTIDYDYGWVDGRPSSWDGVGDPQTRCILDGTCTIIGLQDGYVTLQYGKPSGSYGCSHGTTLRIPLSELRQNLGC